MNRIDDTRWIGGIKDQFNSRILEIVPRLLPAAVLNGNDFLVGDVHGSAGLSMVITASGNNLGQWKDWATGERGDLLDIWMLKNGISTLKDARAKVEDFLGIQTESATQTSSQPRRTKYKKNSITAKQFYANCTLKDRDIDLILRYFVSRALHIPISLIYDFRMMISRQWGKLELVTPIHTPGNEVVQVSRVPLNDDGTRKLNPDGSKAKKKKFGSWSSDCGTLVLKGPILKIFEGLEDGITWLYYNRDDSILIAYGAGGFSRIGGFLTGSSDEI